MVDALSGHTSAKNTLGADGLRDGDALSSPTLTNALQGLRGNGIIRLQEGLFGSTRNAVDGQPGAIAKVSATPSFKLTVTGGYAVLDGQLYEFAGGAGGSSTVTLSDHGGTALTSGDQSLYVVYVASKGGTSRVYAVGGTPTAVANGVYPSLPSDYLSDYDGGSGATNEQVIVIGTVRCAYSSGGTGNNHNVDIIEINDKRHFLRPSPVYMFPVTSGNVGNDSAGNPSQVVRVGNTGVHTAAQLRGLLAGDETGDFGTTANTSTNLINAGALWMSTSRSGSNQGYGPTQGEDRAGQSMKDELFFAAQENSGTAVVSKRLFSKGVEAKSATYTTTAAYIISSHGDQFFVGSVNNGITITLTPEKSNSKYLFPEGHVIEIYNTRTNYHNSNQNGKFVFDPDGLNVAITGSDGGSGVRKKFLFDGSAWIEMPYSTGGVETFLGLGDVSESTFSGKGGKGVRVKADASALEFYDAASALAGIDDQSSGNDDQITIKDTEIVINDDSDASVDFRAESNNQTHMLFVDSSTDGVGVQQSTPLAPLQVKGAGHDYATKVVDSFSTGTATTIDLYSIHEFRACEVLIEVHNLSTNKYEVAKGVITHPYTKLVFEADSQAGGNPTNKILTNVHDSSGASNFDSINVLEAGMKLSGSQMNGAASISSVDMSSTPKTVTMSHAADAASAGLAITAQHEPANDTAVPLTMYSVTQSDSSTSNDGTTQAAYSATVHTNKIRLNLKAVTSNSNGNKMAFRVSWKALALDMDELDWS